MNPTASAPSGPFPSLFAGWRAAGTRSPGGWSSLLQALLLASLVSFGLRAQDANRGFDRANRLYEQGKYSEAAAVYEEILATGKSSATLYYNLGNAWFKAGRLGQAILSYRRAEWLAPRDPDIRANLRFARSAVPANAAPAPPLWERAVTRFTVNEWTSLSAVLFWCWLGLLGVGQWRPALRLSLSRYTLIAGLVWLGSATGLALAWQDRYSAVTAVVVTREAILRHGPLDESPSLQTLQDGQELSVVDRKGNWLQITGAARGRGWLRQDQVTLLTP